MFIHVQSLQLVWMFVTSHPKPCNMFLTQCALSAYICYF